MMTEVKCYVSLAMVVSTTLVELKKIKYGSKSLELPNSFRNGRNINSFIHSIFLVECNRDANEHSNCCTETHKCKDGEGDCDFDVDCEGDLKCGTKNCGDNFPKNPMTLEPFDCCENTGESVFILFLLQRNST